MFWNLLAALWALVVLVFGIAACTGWVVNLIKLVAMAGDPPTAEFFIRLLGVPVVFLGVVMGFIG